MKELDQNELMNVIGGARSVSQKKTDAQLELALTQLGKDIKEINDPKQNQTQTMTMMLAAIAMSRRFA